MAPARFPGQPVGDGKWRYDFAAITDAVENLELQQNPRWQHLQELLGPGGVQRAMESDLEGQNGAQVICFVEKPEINLEDIKSLTVDYVCQRFGFCLHDKGECDRDVEIRLTDYEGEPEHERIDPRDLE